MIPFASNSLSSLCKDDLETFITIAQLDTESGILIVLIPDCRA